MHHFKFKLTKIICNTVFSKTKHVYYEILKNAQKDKMDTLVSLGFSQVVIYCNEVCRRRITLGLALITANSNRRQD